MSVATIRAALRTLADARGAAADATEELKARRAEFEAANIALIEDVERKRTAAAEAEGEARALIDAHYRATKEKSPVKGADVKVFKVYEYDADRALAWARETKLCLVPESLDTKAFEKVASVTALPFVTVKEDPRVQIAAKLNPLDLVDPALAATAPAPEAAVASTTTGDPF